MDEVGVSSVNRKKIKKLKFKVSKSKLSLFLDNDKEGIIDLRGDI